MLVISRTTRSLLPLSVTSARVRLDGWEAANAGGYWVVEQGVAPENPKGEVEGDS